MTRESGKLVEEAIARGDHSAAAQSLLGGIHYSIANTLHRTGKLTEAMAAYQQAIEAQRKLSRTDPSNVVNGKSLARSLCNCGVLLSQTGRETQAMSSYAEARSTLENVAASTPDDHDCQSNLAWIDNATAVLLLQSGKQDEAMRAFERSLAIKQRLADANPNVTYLQSELGVSLLNIRTSFGARQVSRGHHAQPAPPGCQQRLLDEKVTARLKGVHGQSIVGKMRAKYGQRRVKPARSSSR